MYYNELMKTAADLLAIARAERTYAAAFDAVDAAESALAAAEDDDDIERAERMVRRAYGIKADAEAEAEAEAEATATAEAENESGDQVTAAATAAEGAQADHDAASTPNARAITLLRLRAARALLAELTQEMERTEAMADAPPLVRYLPYSPPALPWTGTALILEEDALVFRAASGALIVGNPPDAK